MRGLNPLPDWGLPVIAENVPAILKHTHRWICWRARENSDGRVLKHPQQIDGRMAEVNNPQHRYSWQDAYQAYKTQKFNGLGFVLTGLKKEITVLDLDKAIEDNGDLKDWARRIIDAADSYTEVSPSGKGIRAILSGDAGEFVRAKLGVEVYTQTSSRYLTITGHVIPERPTTINPVTDELVSILDEYRPERDASTQTQGPVTDLSDKELREILREMNVERYEHYDEWVRLGMSIHHQWSGDPEAMELWDELSEKTSSYDREELESTWDSFSLGGTKQVTIRSWLPEHQPEPSFDWNEFPVLDDLLAEGSGGQAEPGSEENGEQEVEGDGGRPGLVEAFAQLGMTPGDQAVESPVPDEIVEDILANREVSAWAGPPGAMKTMGLLDLALHMATPRDEPEPWMGQLVKPGVVLWLAYEGRNAIEKRLRAFRKVRAPVPPQFVLVSPQHPLTEKEWAEWVLKMLRAAKDLFGLWVQLVVVDTFAAATPGVDENSGKDMGPMIRRLRSLAENGRTHVAMIHHSTKSGSDELRGWSGLKGDIDSLLKFEPRGTFPPEVDVIVVKQRNLGTEGWERRSALEPVKTGRLTSFGKDETAPLWQWQEMVDSQDTPEMLDLKQRIRDAGEERGQTFVEAGTWLGVFEEWIVEHAPNAKEQQIKDRRKEALKCLGRGFRIERYPRSNKVETISWGGGQSQTFDDEEDNWGGF